jgi:hypothetical protein
VTPHSALWTEMLKIWDITLRSLLDPTILFYALCLEASTLTQAVNSARVTTHRAAVDL